MKKVLVITILILVRFSLSGFAFVSPATSPLEQGYPDTYLGFTPLDGCKISCVGEYDLCYQECERLYGQESQPDIQDNQIRDETERNSKVEINQSSQENMPVFILQRRWPLPSTINPGTDCTYFTNGTKFCR